MALAVDMGDHIVVARGRPERGARPRGDRRGEGRRFPDKPIRFVVNTHPHFDHASGLAPFVAEGVDDPHAREQRGIPRGALAAPRTSRRRHPREGEPEAECRWRR